jgi:hypothetical protein
VARKDAPDGNIGVRGRPVQQKFGRTGMDTVPVLPWIGTFQEVMSRLVTFQSMPCARALGPWDQYSVDVGAVFNKLFCKDDTWVE